MTLGFGSLTAYTDWIGQPSISLYLIAISISLLVINSVSILAIASWMQVTGHEDGGAPNPADNQKRSSTSVLQTLVCLSLFLVSRVLFIPALEVLIRVAEISDKALNASNGYTYSSWLTFQIINSGSLIVLFLVVFYGKRLMTLNMPYVDMVPWSTASASNIVYLEILAQSAAPVLVALGNDQSYENIMVIGNLVLQLLYLVALVMSTSTFCRQISLL
jgi:hypothetical protein